MSAIPGSAHLILSPSRSVDLNLFDLQFFSVFVVHNFCFEIANDERFKDWQEAEGSDERC